MNKINEKDPVAISQMFEIATQFPDSMSVPPECLNNNVSGAVLLLRMQHLGNLVRLMFVVKGVKLDGTIGWTRSASHVVEADIDGEPSCLKHISGARGKIPVWVTKTCSIENPASCINAVLKHPDGTSVPAVSCYDDGVGPHEFHAKKGKSEQQKVFH